MSCVHKLTICEVDNVTIYCTKCFDIVSDLKMINEDESDNYYDIIRKSWVLNNHTDFMRQYHERLDAMEGIDNKKIQHFYSKYEAFKLLEQLIPFNYAKVRWNDIYKACKYIGWDIKKLYTWGSFAFNILGYDAPKITDEDICHLRIIDKWIRENLNIKLRFYYILFKYCQHKEINYKCIPLKYLQNTLNNYDLSWKKVCAKFDYKYYPTKEIIFILNKNDLKNKWQNIYDPFPEDTKNPVLKKQLNNKGQMVWKNKKQYDKKGIYYYDKYHMLCKLETTDILQ